MQHLLIMAANAVGMDVSKDQMSTQTENLMCHNHSSSEQMHKLDPGIGHSELSRKSECLNNEHKVLDNPVTSSSIDEKLHQVSDMSGNSITRQLGPPQYDLGEISAVGEGSCHQQSILEQVSGSLSNDKSEKECQPASQNVQNEPVENTDDVASFLVKGQKELVKQRQPASENVQNEPVEDLGVVASFLIKGQMESLKDCQPASQNVQNEPVEDTDAVASFLVKGQMESVKECQPASQNVQNEPVENTDAVASLLVEGQMESLKDCQAASQNVQNGPVENTDAVASFPVKGQMESVTSQVNINSGNEQSEPPSGDVGKSAGSECLETKPKRATCIQSGCKNKRTSKLLKKKYTLRSSGKNDRVLRSRTQEKPKAPEQNTGLVHVENAEEKRRGRKKKRRTGRQVVDEYSRIRARLRYLLNRVKYEQSLIDAYSGEGWKGYSMEKLKPEKELQRARSEILRRKLKIRDLFRHLDTLCAEGRLPESLFDSEGEIDSEDIFCAKCGSKDMTTDNDIILCDGACDRGFHQFCLQPPLLTENIPQGDEGWLCPGCDCKDDCLEILNDSLGTNLSISDNWEKVFPEAENKLDQNSGLPSDDSGDDDYNPDVSEDEAEGAESSSDESEYDSASEKLEASNNGDRYIGLPSDDSEDDDFDPNSPDVDRKVTEESSSSDFTSASEDLAATIADSTMDGQVEDPESASHSRQYKGSGRKNCKVGKKKPSLADELSSLLDADPGQEDSKPICGRRHVERLDYKKLYDEAYQNVQSGSSDDEDYTDGATPNRGKKFTGKLAPVSPNRKASMPDHVQRVTAHTPGKNTRQSKGKSADNSPLVKSNPSDKKPGSSTYKKLGEPAVQRLYESFQQNQYPDRATKESLAQEIGLTFRQVSKWFENNRWSFRHSSHMEASMGANASEQATCSKAGNGESHGGSGQKSTTPRSRKRKHKSDLQGSDGNHSIDGAAAKPSAGSPLTRQAKTGRKLKTRRRK